MLRSSSVAGLPIDVRPGLCPDLDCPNGFKVPHPRLWRMLGLMQVLMLNGKNKVLVR